MSSSRPSPVVTAPWRYAGAGTAVVAAGLLLPAGPWRSGTEVAVYLLALLAVRYALREHRPVLLLTWRVTAVALAALGASAVAQVLEQAGVAADVTGVWEARLDLAGYLGVTVAALTALAGGRRRRDWDAWADTGSLLLVAALAVTVLTSEGRQLHRGLAELLVGLPLVTAVVLVACVRVAVVGSGRSPSGIALLLSGTLGLAGTAIRIAQDAEVAPLVEALSEFAVVATAFAARHPSVAVLGRGADPGSAVTVSRVFGLGTALLATPALVLLWTLRQGGTGYWLAAGTAVLTVLALWRLGRLTAERERVRTALAASEARLRVLLENAADVIAIVDGDGRISYVSPAVRELLGHSPGDLLGRRALDLLDAGQRGRLRRAVRRSPGGGPVDADVRLRDTTGAGRWVEVKVSDRVAAIGVDGWVVNLREITDRKVLEGELRHRAATDPLTGLHNRAEFLRRLARVTAAVPAAGAPAVLFVDLDDFKRVNDSLGHAAGDEVLVAVAGRLRHAVRAGDAVARLGGDEFAVLLAAGPAERVDEVAARLTADLGAPLQAAGRTLTVTASIGGARAVPGDTPETLLHRADTAMYGVKSGGKGAYLAAAVDAVPAGA
ncbi:sensor domain-containing diguanylate cyclase [Geodermatophilus sp. DSM 44513]|uniref:sensor domain-containing diguanylate cyclase n=1 Tax=Geodermatophilus sp. DSM 44513 TaxID=1528104 RepID=UPI00128A4B21|nr:sensor domain-containing diguanylate cyclase [Geodermatophilus sp. DSM 44513]WNV75775.1 sensor domain-containing diguanylate cyclase [Geodermatophilus sp. DSM 44513]